MQERPRNGKEWFEAFDQDLWLKDPAIGEEEAQYIWRILLLRKNDSVLDIPCGEGRISLHLAKMGCRITGMDLQAEFIERARERFGREGVSGEFLAMDMRSLSFENRFDAIVNWSGSFGYFSDEENQDVANRMARALRPGGRLLIDQPNREYLLRHFIAESRRENVIIRNTWDPETERVSSDWIIEREGSQQSNPLSIRLYTIGQLKALLKRAGLEFEAAYDREGNAFRRSSRRIAVIGRKE